MKATVLTSLLKSLCLLASLLLMPFTTMGAESYVIDPVHTRVSFEISHAGFSKAIGTFSKIEGHLQFEENDWSKSSVEVNIPLKTLNLGDEKWQAKILEKSFFDEAHFPVAHFASTKIEKKDETTALIYGVLTLRNISVPIILNMQLNAIKRHPLSFKKTIGVSANTTLSRKAFGMTSWQTLIGDEVIVRIEFEATRGKNDSAALMEHDNAAKK
jgi:polyisoprenoid-binding protein YceI